MPIIQSKKTNELIDYINKHDGKIEENGELIYCDDLYFMGRKMKIIIQPLYETMGVQVLLDEATNKVASLSCHYNVYDSMDDLFSYITYKFQDIIRNMNNE